MKANQPSILIIDNDPIWQGAVRACFQGSGLAIRSAASVHEGFACLENNDYRLVILNLILPDLNGMSLLAMIRRLYPALPVLVVSECMQTDEALRAMRLGARGFLTKPLAPEHLLYCVGQIFSERPAGLPQAGSLRSHRCVL